MIFALEIKRMIKKETILAFTGIFLVIIACTVQYEAIKESSPLGLLVIAIAGVLLTIKFRLVGYTLLLFSGLSLAVHPFLFKSTYWLIPGAALIGYVCFSELIKWWNRDK